MNRVIRTALVSTLLVLPGSPGWAQDAPPPPPVDPGAAAFGAVLGGVLGGVVGAAVDRKLHRDDRRGVPAGEPSPIKGPRAGPARKGEPGARQRDPGEHPNGATAAHGTAGQTRKRKEPGQ